MRFTCRCHVLQGTRWAGPHKARLAVSPGAGGPGAGPTSRQIMPVLPSDLAARDSIYESSGLYKIREHLIISWLSEPCHGRNDRLGGCNCSLKPLQECKRDGRREGRQEQKKNAVSKNVGGLCLLVRLLGGEQRQQRKVSEVIFTGYQKRHSTKWPHTRMCWESLTVLPYLLGVWSRNQWT